MFMEIAFIFLVGALFGVVVGLHISRSNPDGCLWMDMSDLDNGPGMRLELSKNVVTLYNKKYATFVVNVTDRFSQK